MACGQQCTLLDLIASINRILSASIPIAATSNASTLRGPSAGISGKAPQLRCYHGTFIYPLLKLTVRWF